MITLTKENLIAQIKQQEEGILGLSLPMLNIHYAEYATAINLSTDTFYTLKKYIFETGYAEKAAIFTNMGFNVLFTTLSPIKVADFASKGIEQAFLDKQQNVFIVSIDQSLDSLYFVLEYPLENNDALANYTVDYAEIQARAERKAAIRNLFKKK